MFITRIFNFLAIIHRHISFNKAQRFEKWFYFRYQACLFVVGKSKHKDPSEIAKHLHSWYGLLKYTPNLLVT